MACRCLEPTVRLASRSADAVVLAEAVALRERPEIRGIEAEVRVLQAWKTNAPAVLTFTTGTTCRYLVRTGERHILFLHKGKEGTFTTGRCMGNAPAKKAGRYLRWLVRRGEAARVLSP